jgi:cytochrome o ubiquinol oxidase subunit 2
VQFSGAGFSDMRFDVVGAEPAAFDDWVSQTKAPAARSIARLCRLVRPSSAVPAATFGSGAPKLFETPSTDGALTCWAS